MSENPNERQDIDKSWTCTDCGKNYPSRVYKFPQKFLDKNIALTNNCKNCREYWKCYICGGTSPHWHFYDAKIPLTKNCPYCYYNAVIQRPNIEFEELCQDCTDDCFNLS